MIIFLKDGMFRWTALQRIPTSKRFLKKNAKHLSSHFIMRTEGCLKKRKYSMEHLPILLKMSQKQMTRFTIIGFPVGVCLRKK